MSVPLCRYCRHYTDGRCFSEARRTLWRHDGTPFLVAPFKMGGSDGCSWAFGEKEREENDNG